jgi:taurine dioxygenase
MAETAATTVLADTSAYPTITVNPITPAIGAEVFGIDLSRTISARQFTDIHHALLLHQVIFFHEQNLTKDALVAFAALFGEPQLATESSFGKLRDHPEIDVLEFGGGKVPFNTKELWHSDFSGRENPTMGSVLHAVNSPTVGGDTIWISMYAAYDALPEKMKRFLGDMKAEHRTIKAFGDDIRSNLWQDEAGRKRFQEILSLPPVEHPVIRTHPITGRKGLYVNEGYTTRLLGIERALGDRLLDYLFEHVRTPEFQVRFRWRQGDVAVWDNRITQHYAVADYTERRVMHRVTIKGDRPH